MMEIVNFFPSKILIKTVCPLGFYPEIFQPEFQDHFFIRGGLVLCSIRNICALGCPSMSTMSSLERGHAAIGNWFNFQKLLPGCNRFFVGTV